MFNNGFLLVRAIVCAGAVGAVGDVVIRLRMRRRRPFGSVLAAFDLVVRGRFRSQDAAKVLAHVGQTGVRKPL